MLLKTFAKLVGRQTSSNIQPNGYEIVCGYSCSFGVYEQLECWSPDQCISYGCNCV